MGNTIFSTNAQWRIDLDHGRGTFIRHLVATVLLLPLFSLFSLLQITRSLIDSTIAHMTFFGFPPSSTDTTGTTEFIDPAP